MKTYLISENESIFASCKIFRHEGRLAAPGRMCLLMKCSALWGDWRPPLSSHMFLFS